MNVTKLYPQYTAIKDRRQQSTAVAFERRLGVERRSPDRISLDTRLTKDVFSIKTKVADLQNSQKISLYQKFVNMLTETPAFTNTIKGLKPQENNNLEKTSSSNTKNSSSTTIAALSAGALVGVMGLMLIGPAAAVVGIGLGAYFGSKILKNAVTSHLKDK